MRKRGLMNQKFQALCTEMGMEVKDNFAHGIVNGYETNVVYRTLSNIAPVTFHISFYASDVQRENIKHVLADELNRSFQKSSRLRYFYRMTAYGLTIGFNCMTVKQMIDRLPAYLDILYNVLNRFDAKGCNYCPLCGNEIDRFSATTVNLNGFLINIESDCIQKVNDATSEAQQAFEETPNHYLKGFWGALLGALCGAVVSIVIGLFGYIGAISAFVSVLVGTKLFTKFGGKSDIVMALIVGLTTLITITISVFILYFAMATIAAREAGILLDPLSAFVTCMSIDEFSRLFYFQLILSIVFTLIGIVLYLLPQFKKRKQLS